MKIFRKSEIFAESENFWTYRPLDKSISRAKFDEQADFDIRSAVARPKLHQIGEKLSFGSEIFADFFRGGVANEKSEIV